MGQGTVEARGRIITLIEVNGSLQILPATRYRLVELMRVIRGRIA